MVITNNHFCNKVQTFFIIVYFTSQCNKHPVCRLQLKHNNDDGERVAYVKSEAPSSPGVKMEILEPPPVTTEAPRKFARPNSLALKPSSVSLKHHHGLTPTMFNQILISPDTPRGDKKYNEQLMNGNYYSNLGLKSSTKPVYCTLNKTQPFYVPHFRKLSMYSEWRQQDNKGDKWYLLEYDSRQRNASYSIAGKYRADKVVDSRYKVNMRVGVFFTQCMFYICCFSVYSRRCD